MPNTPKRPLFHEGQYAVYAAHGVVTVLALHEEEFVGEKILLYVLKTESGSIIKVPFDKTQRLRQIGAGGKVAEVIEVLKENPSKIRRIRGCWRVRARIYADKLATGNLREIAEVVRDLHMRDMGDSSYNARVMYQRSLELLIPEVALIRNTSEAEALEYLSRESGKKLERDGGGSRRTDATYLTVMAMHSPIPSSGARRSKSPERAIPALQQRNRSGPRFLLKNSGSR